MALTYSIITLSCGKNHEILEPGDQAVTALKIYSCVALK